MKSKRHGAQVVPLDFHDKAFTRLMFKHAPKKMQTPFSWMSANLRPFFPA